MNRSDYPIGFIGAGLMGAGMAARFLEAGHPVHVVAHRARRFVDALVEKGAVERSDILDVARNSRIVVLCLPDADVVTTVLTGLEPHLGNVELVVDTTTSLPANSVMWANRLPASGPNFVDAPVTGGPKHAAAGELVSLVGAPDDESYALAAELLAATSKDVVRFGGPGAGHAAKLINNFITQGQSALTIEAMRRCDRLGLDKALIYRVISNSDSRSGTFMKIVPSVLEGTYDGHKFSIGNAAKDIRYVDEVARLAGEDSPVVKGLLEFYRRELETWPPDTLVSGVLRPPDEQ